MKTKAGRDAACRRCSECKGAPHHWMDNPEAEGPEDATHACKHCDAIGDECDTCGGDGEKFSPDGYRLGLCPACDGHGVTERFPKPSGEDKCPRRRPSNNPREGKRDERSTGNRAEQRAGGLRGISSPTKKTALRIELPDGSETVVKAYDPPNLKLFAAKKRGRR